MTLKKSGKVVALVACLFVIAAASACADPNIVRIESGAGFWAGILHGMFAPIAWLASLFLDDIGVYEVRNNGGWYNLGFLLGLSTWGGGGGAASAHVAGHHSVPMFGESYELPQSRAQACTDSSVKTEKVFKVGVVFRLGWTYYFDVPSASIMRFRSEDGPAATPPETVLKTDVRVAPGFVYFLDSDGDVVRQPGVAEDA